jgi:transposase
MAEEGGPTQSPGAFSRNSTWPRQECGFPRLKRYRAVATHYEKTATNFLAVVLVACITTWLN